MTIDEKHCLTLLKAYFKVGHQQNSPVECWWIPTLLKTLSAQKIEKVSVDEDNISTPSYRITLCQKNQLVISHLFPNSPLENPSKIFLKELSEFLKTTF